MRAALRRPPGNRRLLVALAVVALALAGGAAALLARGGGDAPPAVGAARLVPADALVYIHLSTDGARPATARARRLAERFGGYASLRDRLLRRLSADGCTGLDARRLGGREAALALLPGRGGAAGSLVLVDTGADHPAARERSCGGVSARFVGRWLAIGQPESLAKAEALASGRGRALDGVPSYRRAMDGLPAGRVADAWVTRAGVRRLLEPQGGVLAMAGALLDRPKLVGAAAALEAGEHDATLTVRSLAPGAGPAREFRPELIDAVPKDAMAYLGSRGIGPALTSLLAATGGADGLAAAAGALRGAAGDLQRALGPALEDEVALVLTPALPAPTLTLIAGAGDEAATRRALRRAEAPLVRALLGDQAGGSGSPAFANATIGGTGARVLRAGGLEVAYAVARGRLVASTRLDGVAQALAGDGSLKDSAAFRATSSGGFDRVGSVVFLDFSQLLRLGEQTGLSDSRAYQAAKADLEQVQAVGGSTSRAGDVTIARLVLSIP